MEWEVLDVIGEADDADDELNQGMHKQGEVTDFGISQGKHPQLETIIELPAIDILQSIFSEVVSDCAEMQAQLSDVLETKLIAYRPIHS